MSRFWSAWSAVELTVKVVEAWAGLAASMSDATIAASRRASASSLPVVALFCVRCIISCVPFSSSCSSFRSRFLVLRGSSPRRPPRRGIGRVPSSGPAPRRGAFRGSHAPPLPGGLLLLPAGSPRGAAARVPDLSIHTSRSPPRVGALLLSLHLSLPNPFLPIRLSELAPPLHPSLKGEPPPWRALPMSAAKRGERPQARYCAAATVCTNPPSMFLTPARFLTPTGTSLSAAAPEAPLPSWP